MCLPLVMINVGLFMSLSGHNLVFYSLKTFKNKNSCITHPWFTFHASLSASALRNVHELWAQTISLLSPEWLGVCLCVCVCV